MDGVAIAGTGLTIATVKQSNSMLNWRSLMRLLLKRASCQARNLDYDQPENSTGHHLIHAR
jgi:hypothetical protein